MRIRTKFIGATDTAGEKIVAFGPQGQRTYSYDYGQYDMHDTAVMRYAEEMDRKVSQDELFELPHPRRRLSRSGRGYVYVIPPAVPFDYPVRVLTGTEARKAADSLAICGECGRAWDDAISTSMTPTPAARCPFEAFHV